MYMRCDVPLPGMLARMPTDEPAMSQLLIVAQSSGGEAEAAAVPALAAAGAMSATSRSARQIGSRIARMVAGKHDPCRTSVIGVGPPAWT